MQAGTVTEPARSRFHLTLATAGRPVMHGWWADEVTGRMLASWPDET